MEWESVYRAYYLPVYRYVYSICRDQQQSQDVCSETFIKAFKTSKTLKNDESLQSWLFAIARNTLFSSWKKTEREVLIDTLEWDNTSKLENEPINSSSHSRKPPDHLLPQLIHQLDHPAQEIVMWRLYGNMEFSEIGSLFNKTGNWACVTYHRAMDKINLKMKEEITKEMNRNNGREK